MDCPILVNPFIHIRGRYRSKKDAGPALGLVGLGVLLVDLVLGLGLGAQVVSLGPVGGVGIHLEMPDTSRPGRQPGSWTCSASGSAG